YHSWAVRNDLVPDVINVTATDPEGVIMALSHRTLDVRGVQFHPESVLTEHGKLMISNWLS
ncbi:MAG: gamma-glutamyl-gamma-aminobutyrate hydrolase family protein, partial [Daejeonella sp.]|nr:gamma-glutamyl-gamma-aminobutyrate hydrolase family protein [Daejeonella sp.]